MFNNDKAYAVSRILETHMRTTDNTLEYIIDIIGVDNNLNNAKILAIGLDRETNERHISNYHYQVGPLGYINTESGTMYVVRTTIREDWRQGLRARQLLFSVPGDALTHAGREFVFDNLEGFNNCLQGKYPTLTEEFLEEIEEENKSKAFAKHYAVSNKFDVFYKTHKIGKVDTNGKLVINKDYSFLSEQLQKITDNYELA